ncbi:MAG: DUF4357 domain-containing protein [Actinobacteria bacterium]|nr:DUF4357 domain-containing protein [Actinomycetota bacterium]
MALVASLGLLHSQILSLEVVLFKGGRSITQDYLFASPSLAAGVLLGRPANGRVEWKTTDGRTLKDIQDSASGASG